MRKLIRNTLNDLQIEEIFIFQVDEISGRMYGRGVSSGKVKECFKLSDTAPDDTGAGEESIPEEKTYAIAASTPQYYYIIGYLRAHSVYATGNTSTMMYKQVLNKGDKLIRSKSGGSLQISSKGFISVFQDLWANFTIHKFINKLEAMFGNFAIRFFGGKISSIKGKYDRTKLHLEIHKGQEDEFVSDGRSDLSIFPGPGSPMLASPANIYGQGYTDKLILDAGEIEGDGHLLSIQSRQSTSNVLAPNPMIARSPIVDFKTLLEFGRKKSGTFLEFEQEEVSAQKIKEKFQLRLGQDLVSQRYLDFSISELPLNHTISLSCGGVPDPFLFSYSMKDLTTECSGFYGKSLAQGLYGFKIEDTVVGSYSEYFGNVPSSLWTLNLSDKTGQTSFSTVLSPTAYNNSIKLATNTISTSMSALVPYELLVNDDLLKISTSKLGDPFIININDGQTEIKVDALGNLRILSKGNISIESDKKTYLGGNEILLPILPNSKGVLTPDTILGGVKYDTFTGMPFIGSDKVGSA